MAKRGWKARCGATLALDPDIDPEPLCRCMRAEHHELPHQWDTAKPWYLSQRNPQPVPMHVMMRGLS